MFKTKEEIEEMAKEYANSFSSRKFEPYNNTLTDYKEGATQMQKDLLDSASKSFNDWLWGVNFGGTTQTEISRMGFAWEMAKLSSMKELQEKDKEIDRLKEEVRNLTRADLIQTNREDVLPAVQEAAHYNWLDDQNDKLANLSHDYLMEFIGIVPFISLDGSSIHEKAPLLFEAMKDHESELEKIR